MSKKSGNEIIENASRAKHFIECTGEDALPDEMLVRGSVAWSQLLSQEVGQRGVVAQIKALLDRHGATAITMGDKVYTLADLEALLGTAVVKSIDDMAQDHAIATIAANFSDHPPSTPERRALFSTILNPEPDPVAVKNAAELAEIRRAYEDAAGVRPTMRELVAAIRKGAPGV